MVCSTGSNPLQNHDSGSPLLMQPNTLYSTTWNMAVKVHASNVLREPKLEPIRVFPVVKKMNPKSFSVVKWDGKKEIGFNVSENKFLRPFYFSGFSVFEFGSQQIFISKFSDYLCLRFIFSKIGWTFKNIFFIFKLKLWSRSFFWSATRASLY